MTTAETETDALSTRETLFGTFTFKQVPCGICGAPFERMTYLFEKWGFEYRRCGGCGILLVDPQPVQESLNQRYVRDYFDNEYLPSLGFGNGFDPEVNERHWSMKLTALERHARPPGTLLDIGCGMGFFLVAARDHDWEVQGIELSDYAARYGREQLGVPILSTLAEQSALPAESFDVVTLWDAIEHIQQPLAVLREVSRVLKPGGVLGLSTPNIRCLSYLLLGKHYWVLGPREHIYYYDARSLRRILRPLGFEVVKSFTNGIHTVGLPNADAAPFPRRQIIRFLNKQPYYDWLARSGWGDELMLYARKR